MKSKKGELSVEDFNLSFEDLQVLVTGSQFMASADPDDDERLFNTPLLDEQSLAE